MLGKLVLLSLLSLATGKLDYSILVNPKGDKDSPAILEFYAKEEKIRKTDEAIFHQLVYKTKSLNLSGIICDSPFSQGTSGELRAFSAKIFLDLKKEKIDYMRNCREFGSSGCGSFDDQANLLVKEILSCPDEVDQSEDGKGIMIKFELTLPDKHVAVLHMAERHSPVERNLMTAKHRNLVEFGVSCINWEPKQTNSKRPHGYVVLVLYAYKINVTKETVPSTLVQNILQQITKRRKAKLFPQYKTFPAMHTEAELYVAALFIKMRYSQKTTSTNKNVGKPNFFNVFGRVVEKHNNITPQSSDEQLYEANQTDTNQSPQFTMAMSFKGPNQSCFIFLDVGDHEKPEVAVLDYITKKGCTQPLSEVTPQGLQSLKENTPLDLSLYLKLILTTDTLGIGVVREGKRVSLVVHTQVNPLLTEDWKLPFVAYLNNTIAHKLGQSEPNRPHLAMDMCLDVKLLMEPLLAKFVVGDGETIFGLGVVPKIQPNDNDKVFLFKLEYRPTEFQFVRNTEQNCDDEFKKGSPVVNNIIDTHFKDILRHSVFQDNSEILPILKVENDLKSIIYYYSNVPSSHAHDHLVSLNTEQVTYDVFSVDQEFVAVEHKDKLAIASVFFCHKISSVVKLGTELRQRMLSKLSMRTSNNFLQQSESTVAQKVAVALQQIPFGEKYKSSVCPRIYSGLVKICGSYLIFFKITNREFTTVEEVVDDVVTRIRECTKYHHLLVSRAELLKFEQGFHQPSSYADPCLIANSLTVDYAISIFDKCTCFVVETNLPEMEEIDKWEIGSVAVGQMINNAREKVGAEAFSNAPIQTAEIHAFAQNFFTLLKPDESNSNAPRRGLGMYLSSSTGSAFSYRLDSYPRLSRRSTMEEWVDQVQLQTKAHVENILAKTDPEEGNNALLRWIGQKIVMFQGGSDASHLDFRQMTSDNWTVLNYSNWVHLDDNNGSVILTVLVYQGAQFNTLADQMTDTAVENFINGFKSSKHFRTVKLSTENRQALQFAQVVTHLIPNGPGKGEGIIGATGLVRHVDSWFIFVEILGANIPIETVLKNIAGFWNGNNNTEHKFSTEELLKLELGQIHWNVPVSQLALVLASNTVSYSYTTTDRRTYLVKQVTLPKILPPDWSTPNGLL